MPVFDGLFPEPWNGIVQTMLFELANFYSLARLRLHTEGTLVSFEGAVATLGKAMREFLTKVCKNCPTTELPKETASRKRRQAKKDGDGGPTSAKDKSFNLNTYKWHRLGDYPRAVREYGPLDGYSTQTVRRRIARGTDADAVPGLG